MRVNKVYKYSTSEVVPSNAVYLCTKIQTEAKIDAPESKWAKCWLVWHYFLVEVEEGK